MPKKPAKTDQIWPRIRPVINKDGSTSYQVDTRLNGEGARLSFSTKAEAQTVAEQARIKRRSEGDSAFQMAAGDRIDAENALRVLRRHGITLKQAADFSIRHQSTIVNPKPIMEVVEERLQKLAQDEFSKDHIDTCKHLWRRFAVDHAHLTTAEIDTPIVDRWLRGQKGISSETRNHYAARISGLFSYSVKQKYAVENPLKGLERVKTRRTMPAVLTIQQVIDLLKNTDSFLMPSLLLGLFAGLRPYSEVCRLRWERINFETKQIYIAPGCTKNIESVRFVDISDNLLEWLLPYRKPEGLVIRSRRTYCYGLRQTCAKAGFDAKTANAITSGRVSGKHGRWGSDVLRHTFCSMYLAKHKNMPATIDQMGHTGSRMIYKHYRAVVTPQDAEIFWNICPVAITSNVVCPDLLLPALAKEYLSVFAKAVEPHEDDLPKQRRYREARRHCTRFSGVNSLLRVAEVQTDHVEAWLDSLGVTRGSKNYYRVSISAMFKFAVDRGYTLGNPCCRSSTGPFLDVAEPSESNIVPMLAAG